jgi:hypothetical protein
VKLPLAVTLTALSTSAWGQEAVMLTELQGAVIETEVVRDQVVRPRFVKASERG